MQGPLALPDGTVHDPLLQRLHAYWLDRAAGRAMPSRAEIDPVEMGFILGHLLLVEVLREPLDFRIRLHGTELARRAGYELTGRMLSELPIGDFRSLARESFTTTVETGRPFHSRRERTIAGRVHGYETLMLPLSSDGQSVDMLLVGLRYRDVA
jgi:hypothetical protein